MNTCTKCGKTFDAVPGEHRDESLCLRCERDRLKGENQDLHAEMWAIKTASHKIVQYHQKVIAESERTKAELECGEGDLYRVQKQAAEMRDVLLYLKPTVDKDGIPEEIESMDHVLSRDADQGYLSPAEAHELVKPLVEALIQIGNNSRVTDGDVKQDIAIRALEYAKAKGWL